jgi:hypothetical protein
MRAFRRTIRFAVLSASLAAAAAGQDTAASPSRPPEGSVVIDLPSAEVPAAGTLGLLFTHRFSEPVQDSDFHSLYSFDSGADIGIGLSYVPIRGLEVGVLRNRSLEDYEFSAEYRLRSFAGSPVSIAMRAGLDYRNQRHLTERTTAFGQAILAVSLLSRIRITAVPTYVSRTAGQIVGILEPAPQDVFNVPVAISAAVTPTVNVHAEFVPRHENPGASWIVSIEKTVLRHRFAFTAGTLRPTTVDQYLAYDFEGLPRSNVYVGFNIVRQWKLK